MCEKAGLTTGNIVIEVKKLMQVNYD
jgi:hypothetical protein